MVTSSANAAAAASEVSRSAVPVLIPEIIDESLNIACLVLKRISTKARRRASAAIAVRVWISCHAVTGASLRAARPRRSESRCRAQCRRSPADAA